MDTVLTQINCDGHNYKQLYLVPNDKEGFNSIINSKKEAGMELLLDKKELLNMKEDMTGVRIACRDGRCWITQTGDSRDHVLKPGASYQASTSGQLIIVALEPCRLTFTTPNIEKQQMPFLNMLGGLLKRYSYAGR
jgi:hypothetical protein